MRQTAMPQPVQGHEIRDERRKRCPDPVRCRRGIFPIFTHPPTVRRLRRTWNAPNASAKSFAAAHAGTLGSLSGSALAAVIAEYERIQEILGRVASYAQLLFAGNSTDPAIGRFYQTVKERVTGISSDLIFFTLE